MSLNNSQMSIKRLSGLKEGGISDELYRTILIPGTVTPSLGPLFSSTCGLLYIREGGELWGGAIYGGRSTVDTTVKKQLIQMVLRSRKAVL